MPPGFPGGWDDLDVVCQSRLLGYHQQRSFDESEEKTAMMKAMYGA